VFSKRRRQEVDVNTERLVDVASADQDVLAVMLFGSRARGDEGPTSDRDICLVLQPDCCEESKLSRKRLEYLKIFDFDIQVFQQLPLYIRKRVLKEGEVLSCRDEGMLYEVAFRTAQQIEDFRHIHENYLEEVARG